MSLSWRRKQTALHQSIAKQALALRLPACYLQNSSRMQQFMISTVNSAVTTNRWQWTELAGTETERQFHNMLASLYLRGSCTACIPFQNWVGCDVCTQEEVIGDDEEYAKRNWCIGISKVSTTFEAFYRTTALLCRERSMQWQRCHDKPKITTDSRRDISKPRWKSW